MPTLTVGQVAPWPSSITTQDGKPVRLADYAGRHVLVYFYPRDDTPGCTIEACNFRDHAASFPNTVIFGASLDGAASHQAFKAKFQLPFDLLVDAQKELATAFGALPQGAQTTTRSSVLIDPSGLVKALWPKVDAKTHYQEVQRALAG